MVPQNLFAADRRVGLEGVMGAEQFSNYRELLIGEEGGIELSPFCSW